MIRRIILIALTLAIIIPGNTQAEGGIGITPAVREVTLEKDQLSVSFKIGLYNGTSSNVALSLSALDFGSLNESGGIAFLGLTGQETSPYGLKQWMNFDKDSIELEPGESRDVEVTIANQESLGPGGHYGAVIVSANSGNSDNKDVSVVPAASSLVLLKKSGGEKLEINLDSVTAKGSIIKLPDSIEIKFHNSGNTHVVPRGIVELNGPFSSKIAKNAINETSAFVLPDSSRIIKVPLKVNQQPWLPGRYKLNIVWRYDGRDETETFAVYQWYIGKLTLYLLGVIILLLVIILRIRAKRRVSRGA